MKMKSDNHKKYMVVRFCLFMAVGPLLAILCFLTG